MPEKKDKLYAVALMVTLDEIYKYLEKIQIEFNVSQYRKFTKSYFKSFNPLLLFLTLEAIWLATAEIMKEI